jgi:O-antigen ligase
LKEQFFPHGGLIHEQSQHPGWRGGGRIADLPAAFDEFGERPLLGQGYASRQTGRERGTKVTATILDDQWLKTLLETGVVGTVAWLWLFLAYIRRLSREAKADRSDRGWLLVALASSVSAFAVGMFFFDAFSFIQVTFIVFILLGFGSALTAPSFREARRRVPRMVAAPAAVPR